MKRSRSGGAEAVPVDRSNFGAPKASRDVCSEQRTTSAHLAAPNFYNRSSSESRLPPGFRFHPTDGELVSHYLTNKIGNIQSAYVIQEVDFNSCEPWNLHEVAKTGESMLYFFAVRDRKYPTGMRTNRATKSGYWKATGKDRPVMSSTSRSLVGMKKTLVFYTGRAPTGLKTNWIMHEYRLESALVPGEEAPEWVVCRLFYKSEPLNRGMEFNHDTVSSDATGSTTQPCGSLPPLHTLETRNPKSLKHGISEVALPMGGSSESIPIFSNCGVSDLEFLYNGSNSFGF